VALVDPVATYEPAESISIIVYKVVNQFFKLDTLDTATRICVIASRMINVLSRSFKATDY